MIEGRYQDALESAEQALVVAEQIRDDALRSRPLAHRGAARCVLGDVGGIDDLREAVAIAEQHGATRTEIANRHYLAEHASLREGPLEAYRLEEEAANLALRRGLVEPAMWMRGDNQSRNYELGRWDEAIDECEELLGWARKHDAVYMQLFLEFEKTRIGVLRGKVCDPSPDELLSRARTIGDAQLLVPIMALCVVEATLANDHAPGARVTSELQELASKGSIGWHLASELPALARGCQARQDGAALEDFRSRVASTYVREELSLATAEAALVELRGESDHAVSLWQDLALRWEAYGNVVEMAYALLGWARTLSAAGLDPESPRAKAVGIFRRLRATPLVSQTEGLTNAKT